MTWAVDQLLCPLKSTAIKSFGLGTGAWALWLDLDGKRVRVCHYAARMVIPLSWDEDGVTECAFYRGGAVGQLQMHLNGGMEALA